MNTPAISVVMPVFNEEEHLAEAVDSILAQSMEDFEFIIVDDASTDATPAILAGYAQRDTRIRVLTNAINSKIAASLNRGLAEARAPLIARMDADDWAYPQRLARQYAYMQSHPEVTVCGSLLEFYENGEILERAYEDADIRLRTLLDAAIAHPTAMFRKETVLRLTGGYDVTKPPAEDYDLWARLSVHAEVRFANLPEVLLRYRLCPDKDRGDYYIRQKNVVKAVRCAQLGRLGIEPSGHELLCHAALEEGMREVSLWELFACWQWKRKLLAHNARAQVYEQRALQSFLQERWHRLIVQYRDHDSVRSMCARFSPGFVRAWYRFLKQHLKT